MRAFVAAVVVVSLAALALGVAGQLTLRRVNADVARDALAVRLEQALALPVELGAAELLLLPRPALRVHDVRIGADGGPRVGASLLRV
ncbi:MAG TPA: hypothetical protein VNF72_11420, partial [Myxococcota bacterium]|nr:hypothetical protein [Myxococcota bacterium]